LGLSGGIVGTAAVDDIRSPFVGLRIIAAPFEAAPV